jgi:hypothetical protein
MISSRSERRRVYRAKGLREKPVSEARRQGWYAFESMRGGAVSYPGQTDHRSSAERGGVRANDGREVI